MNGGSNLNEGVVKPIGGLWVSKHFRAPSQTMHPGFPQLLAGLADIVDASYHRLERALEIVGEIRPVFGLHVLPGHYLGGVGRNGAAFVVAQDPTRPVHQLKIVGVKYGCP